MTRIISPSMLSADFGNLERDTKMIDRSAAEWVHIDVMDGVFVPNISFGAPVIKSLRKCTKLAFDVHLMISNPIKYIKDFVQAGADIVTLHYESVSNVAEAIAEVKSYNKMVGLAIKPETKLEK